METKPQDNPSSAVAPAEVKQTWEAPVVTVIPTRLAATGVSGQTDGPGTS